MERSRISLCKTMKQQKSSDINSITQNVQETNVYKSRGTSWDICREFKLNKNTEDGNSAGAGFSWPPRCYSCSFCRREFKSAQALGGHMNVHRRDRARMRHFSPPKNNNLNHDSIPSSNPPNPHLYTSSIDRTTLAGIKSLRKDGVFVQNLKPRGGDLVKMETQKAFNGVKKFDPFVCEKGCEVVKEDLVRLDLKIGLITHCSHDKELDLELRLGYT